ncbi:DNA-binding transcriptional LysR family regulator [Paraburkholderia fungorum]|nr:LysR family transcriptional regulator [Paraburkholderia fungorum]MBB4517481.1 DNA-binding transcriptional LysR family regulator [Paraburkholderia fungorum]
MTAFAKVVECGTFSGAARRLHIAPPVITRRVQDLEFHLGVRLFNRTTRRICLTEVGQMFYERCVRILAELEETENAASLQQAELRGVLRVNASLSFGMLHLAPAIAHFTARYPEVSVELTLTDRVVDLIEEGFDLAVRAEPLPDSSLVARRLAPCRSVVCAAPSYLTGRGVPRSPADLTAHNCLTLSTSLNSAEWVFTDAERHAQRVRVAGNLRANSSGALVAAAIEGQGLILEQTCTVGEELKAGRLVAVLTDYGLPEAAIHAAFPHRLLLSGKVRTFVDFLAARFGHDPDWDDWRRGMSPQPAAEAPCDCVAIDEAQPD